MSKLKPCPFCGSEEVSERIEGNVYFIYCYACGACGPEGETAEEAAKLWDICKHTAGIIIPEGEVNAKKLRELMKELANNPKYIVGDP